MKLAVGAVVMAFGGLALVLFVFSGSEKPVTSTGITLPTPTPRVATLGDVTFTVAAANQRQFAWPADGPLLRYFGTSESTGIDIALDGADDTPVRASTGGRVIFAAGNPCCEYGYTVILDHGNGYSTLYGHLQEMLVSFGQDVKQGDWLGFGGTTGNAPTKQLHFELRRGSEYLDPLRFLAYQERNAYNVQTAQCPSETLRIDVASTVALTFLPSSAIEFQVEGASLKLRSGFESPAPPKASVENGASVVITVPEAPAATGDAFRYYLEAVLRQGERSTTMICNLELAYRRTLPNPELPVGEAPSSPQGPLEEGEQPAPTQTPTPKAEAPKPTVAPSQTAPAGTPTPRGPQGLKSPTPRSGPKGLQQP
jgi:hypothetical protein